MSYLLPKGYLSWSQFSLWEQSHQKYIDQYIYDKKSFETDAMRAGKSFGLSAQKGSADDKGLQELLDRLPKRALAECELNVDYEGIPLKIIFDSADDNGFEEYKTGSVPWDDKRAFGHGQMKFYSLGFYLETGKLPVCALHWLPTFKSDTTILLTGEIHSFSVAYTLEELEAFGIRIKKVAEGITHYKQYEKKIITI